MSKPVSIELDGLFKAFDISSVEEVTLGKVPLNTLGLQFYQKRVLISFNRIFNNMFEHLTFLTIENIIGYLGFWTTIWNLTLQRKILCLIYFSFNTSNHFGTCYSNIFLTIP